MNVYISAISHVQPATMTLPAELSRQLRRADTFIQLAVSAAHQALLQGPVKPPDLPERSGLFIGTAHGPMQTGFEVLDHLIDNEQTSPTLFSHSVFNAAAGYLSRIFSLQGRALTMTDFAWPFFQALQQGYMAMRTGRIDRCLILQTETYSELLMTVGDGLQQPSPGCVCWLLDARAAENTPYITSLAISSRPGSAEMYLNRRETLYCNGDHVSVFADPLAAPACLGQAIGTGTNSAEEYVLTAPYGEVRLEVERYQHNQAAAPLNHHKQ